MGRKRAIEHVSMVGAMAKLVEQIPYDDLVIQAMFLLAWIDSNGLYRAPAKTPSPREIQICAEVDNVANRYLWATVLMDAPGPAYELVGGWTEEKPDTKYFVDPHCVCLDKDGNLIVADYNGSKVMRFAPDGTYLGIIGLGTGERPGQVTKPRVVQTDSEGRIADSIALEDRASKGKKGGRSVPVHPHLKEALERLQALRGSKARPDWPVIYSERDKGLSAGSVTVWFHRLYNGLGMQGCSSHSGRRTFVTRAAQNITKAGGSLRDVQQLAGHSSLQTTQRYIEGDAEAKKKVVEMI